MANNIGTIGNNHSGRRITGLYAPHLVRQLSDIYSSVDSKMYALRNSARQKMTQCINDLESSINIMSHDMLRLDNMADKKSRLAVVQELTIKKNYLVELQNQLSNPCNDALVCTIKSFTASTGVRVVVEHATVTL